MKVLVVEDDRSVRETLGLVLESYEHAVWLVEGGEEALAALEKEWPDVMLLDLALVGMSGDEVYARINEKFGRVPPTIVFSALQHAQALTSKMKGARFLAKPYTLEQLRDALNDVAGQKRAA